MDKIKEEMLRQIQDNKKYIEENYKYDFDFLEDTIEKVFFNGEVNYDKLEILNSLDYLKSDSKTLRVVIDNYVSLDRIKKIFQKGLGNIDVEVYSEILNECNNQILSFIESNGINFDSVKCMINLLKGNNLGFDNSWMDSFTSKIIEVIDRKNKQYLSEIKELIISLKNKVVELKFQEYNPSNNRRNRNINIQKIYSEIKIRKEKNTYLKSLLDEVFVGNTVIPCKDYNSFKKLIEFISECQLSENDKVSIIYHLYTVNYEYVKSLNEQNITNAIDANALEIMDELSEREGNTPTVDNQETIRNISFDDIMSDEIILSLGLSENELAIFEEFKNHLVAHINSSNPTSKSLDNADNMYLIDELKSNPEIKRMDLIADGNNRIEWDLVITDLYQNRMSKTDVLDIATTVIEFIKQKEFFEEQNRLLDERMSQINDIESDIDEFIYELTKIYKREREEEKNKIIIALSNFKNSLNNFTEEIICDDEKFKELLNSYSDLSNMFNDFYNSEYEEEKVEISQDFDINKNNYIIFDESVKKQISKYNEKFYLKQIIDCINFLRSKEKMNGISKDTNVKHLGERDLDVYEVKDKKIRIYYTKINNYTYYVSGIMKKKTEGSSFVDDLMSRYSNLGNKMAEEYKEKFKTMTKVEINDLCEKSWEEVIDIINSKYNNNKQFMVGGE